MDVTKISDAELVDTFKTSLPPRDSMFRAELIERLSKNKPLAASSVSRETGATKKESIADQELRRQQKELRRLP